MCDVGYLCANFSLPGPLYSRFRLDLRDRQTSDRHQTSDRRQTRNASALWGRGIINVFAVARLRTLRTAVVINSDLRLFQLILTIIFIYEFYFTNERIYDEFYTLLIVFLSFLSFNKVSAFCMYGPTLPFWHNKSTRWSAASAEQLFSSTFISAHTA